jgi:uncharacterized membrane protein YhaH (DUF805 family)
MEYFIDAFRKYADFSGRAHRKQYWMFVLIYSLVYIVLALIDAALGSLWLTSIFSLVIFVPSMSIGARRLHDTGRTGWWQLIYIIPLIGLIVMLVFLSQESHSENEYGLCPKST